MELNTHRLKIIPLTYDQLNKYLKADGSLEKELGVSTHPRHVPPPLAEAFNAIILPAVADPANNPLFNTLWTIIDKEENVMVADLCFKGEPNENGEVEIGYGTYDEFQGRGYMTEAISAIVKWGLEQPGVKAVIAETANENIASQKLLLNNGFTVFSRTPEMIWWRLNRKQ